MNIEEIKSAKTNKIGKKIEYYKTINSTHIYAKQIANKSKNDGMLILAEQQTGGIGTKGRKWFTGYEKNIATTIILYPKYKINQLSNLTIYIATKIKEAIKELYDYNLEIKEPNDLLLNNKKICGILTEIHTQGEQIKYLLISFGFNVNEESFSEETKNLATSLKNEFKNDFCREEILKKILEKLEEIPQIN